MTEDSADSTAPDSSEQDQTTGEKHPEGDGAARDDEQRLHRRGFFREGLRQFLKPLAEIVEQRVEDAALTPLGGRLHRADLRRRVRQRGPVLGRGVAGSVAAAPAGRAPRRGVPRPLRLERRLCRGLPRRRDPPRRRRRPGEEQQAGHRSGLPGVCPVRGPLLHERVSHGRAPPGRARQDIDMGVAVVRHDVCVRSQGEDCQICVDKCPVGPLAIEIPEYDGEVEVKTGRLHGLWRLSDVLSERSAGYRGGAAGGVGTGGRASRRVVKSFESWFVARGC